MVVYVDYGKGWRAHKSAARKMATKHGHTLGPWKSAPGAQWADCTECGEAVWATHARHSGIPTYTRCPGKVVPVMAPAPRPRYWYTLGRVT